MLPTRHCRQLIPPRTPKARVAGELSVRAHTLQEQYPGARTQAPCQRDAHTERRSRPRWMDDGALADTNKAEAVLIESLTLLAWLGKTAFLKKLSFRRS
jgi:hypothetical protein